MATLVLGACLIVPAHAEPRIEPGTGEGGIYDATVVAVIDFNLVPYHWDFLASRMPQHLDDDPGNDLPLDTAPHEWLPGFPDPDDAFESYNRFDLTLEEKDPNTRIRTLDDSDSQEWQDIRTSVFESGEPDLERIHYYWFPGTKIIGGIEFGSAKLHGTPDDHGLGVTSVSVGNIHGTCPECLLLFINLDDTANNGNEASAIQWAMKQPWIDLITNSYGHGYSAVIANTKIHHGPDVPDQKKASERGQTIFFSGGNGIDDAYSVPNSTYHSSQKGPDWVVTVGGVSEYEEGDNQETSGSHASYLGTGKPVDVAAPIDDYPSAYEALTVGGTGPDGFNGTSNAAPTIAGTYARALHISRTDLVGPSRVQRAGVIARGKPYDCGSLRPTCELGDGVLTAVELRRRLLLGAAHTKAGMTFYLPVASTPPIAEAEFLSEGHGTYFARESGDVRAWLKEFFRIIGPLEGHAEQVTRPAGEREWMIVDSYCRQHLWGNWRDGYYVENKTELPGPDPNWPIRSSLEASCPAMQPPPR